MFSPKCPKCAGMLSEDEDPEGFVWTFCRNCGHRWSDEPAAELDDEDMLPPKAPVDPALLERVRAICRERAE